MFMKLQQDLNLRLIFFYMWTAKAIHIEMVLRIKKNILTSVFNYVDVLHLLLSVTLALI